LIPIPIWRRLLAQFTRLARSLAFDSAGSNIAARIAMIAITTSSSISVNPPFLLIGPQSTGPFLQTLLIGGDAFFGLAKPYSVPSARNNAPFVHLALNIVHRE